MANIYRYNLLRKTEEDYKNMEIPEMHIIHGDKDYIVPIEDTKEFVSLNPKKIRIYKN